MPVTPFWRRSLAYVALAVLTLAGAGCALLVMHGLIIHWLSLCLLAIFIGSAAWVDYIHRQSQSFSLKQIRKLVGATLQQDLQLPLLRACALSELRGGQATWISLGRVGTSQGGSYVNLTTPGVAKPQYEQLGLVVMDDKGRLHLFRFGLAPGTQLYRSDETSRQVVDHGYIGVARFDASVFA